MTIQRLSAAALACCALLISASTSIAQSANCVRLSHPFPPQRPAVDLSNRADPAALADLLAPHYPPCWKTSDCRELSEFGEILNAYVIAWMEGLDRDVEIRFDDEAGGRCWIAAREGPPKARAVTLPSGTYRVAIDSPQSREIDMRIRLAGATLEVLSADYIGPQIADVTNLTKLLNTPTIAIDPRGSSASP